MSQILSPQTVCSSIVGILYIYLKKVSTCNTSSQFRKVKSEIDAFDPIFGCTVDLAPRTILESLAAAPRDLDFHHDRLSTQYQCSKLGV